LQAWEAFKVQLDNLVIPVLLVFQETLVFREYQVLLVLRDVRVQ